MQEQEFYIAEEIEVLEDENWIPAVINLKTEDGHFVVWTFEEVQRELTVGGDRIRKSTRYQ